MSLQTELATELRRRAQLLPAEVAAWKAQTDRDENRMGIHQSQVAAINLLLDGFLDRQAQLLATLDPMLPQEAFADRRNTLERELAAAHGIMDTFRHILAQRADTQRYRPVLDAADLIAADCYRTRMDQAADWGVIGDDQYREPPLTFLNAMSSAVAYSRRHSFGVLGVKLPDYLELKLPISVISLPFHDVVVLWSLCSIYHEVGHLLDQDLGLRQALREPLEGRLAAAKTPKKRRGIWSLWLGEMIGDAFGVLLGGVAFAHALEKMLFSSAARVTALSDDMHPNEYVRIFLLGSLLREAGLPELAAAADEIENVWRTSYGEPAALTPFVSECRAIATVLLGQPLPALKGHSLADLSPTLADDHKQVAGLARYLRLGFNRPDPAGFPFRLAPAAAQTAIRQVTADFEPAYDGIHDRTLGFIQAKEAPKYLDSGGLTAGRRAYLASLVQNLDFAVFSN